MIEVSMSGTATASETALIGKLLNAIGSANVNGMVASGNNVWSASYLTLVSRQQASYDTYVRTKLLNMLLEKLERAIALGTIVLSDINGTSTQPEFTTLLGSTPELAAAKFMEIMTATRALDDIMDGVQDIDAQLAQGWVDKLL